MFLFKIFFSDTKYTIYQKQAKDFNKIIKTLLEIFSLLNLK